MNAPAQADASGHYANKTGDPEQPNPMSRDMSPGQTLGLTANPPRTENGLDGGMSMDMSQNDIGDEGRWMTYGELAAARGIDRASAMRLARRNGWRKQKDNHGNLRALVPLEHQAKDLSEDTDRDAPPDRSRDMSGDDPRATIAVLQTALETLREQLAREQRRADAAETEARELRVTAAELEALKARIATAEASIAEVHRLRLLTPWLSPVAGLLTGLASLFVTRR